MISLEQVQTFTHVYEQGSYSAAARVANKERSTVREHILALEDTLGVKLFDIQGRKAIPTQNADKLILRSKNLSKHAEDFTHVAMRLYQKPLSKFTLWHDELIPTQWLGDITKATQKAFPDIEVECIASDRNSAYRAIEEQRCHVALMSSEINHNISGNLKFLNLGSLKMNGYCHPNSDLARNSSVILSDLQLSPQYILANSKRLDLGYFEAGNKRHKVSSVKLAVQLIQDTGWIVLSEHEAGPWVSQGELTKLKYKHVANGYIFPVNAYFGLISDEQKELETILKLIHQTARDYLL
ncbi:LysR family transcriptional regulator [Vibrio agarivorans]|uniref:LysR family transcriptional regulator n=1 Tax=Vibrio agarivorans TaxID=153622 RepID=A0ABT7Y5G9_9VIBR|nr:LysR family transcriptional regulator [Vibrio agarivorans]MDN2483293.1 LysR family transcriptional regulator [Vibrio agarivorans]